MTKKQYIKEIVKQMQESNDLEVLEFIHKLLQKMEKAEKTA